MAVERVTPDRAAGLVRGGWVYLDVRSVPEFEEGHPQGAYNVPIEHRDGDQKTPNDEFLAVLERVFSKETPLVVGCRSGRRSLRAAEMLLGAGFERVVDMRGGYEGERAEEELTCEGWLARGLPIARTAEPGRSYRELRG